MIKYQRPKGTHDIVPPQSKIFKAIEQKFETIVNFYGYQYIETPIIEHTELFLRSVGESSDIASKEMYSFKTRGGDELSIRPEGTAPIVRAYIENGLRILPHPLKLYYFGPFLRHEKPQQGRYRQFHHAGLEIIGSKNPIVEAEILEIAKVFLEELGFKNFKIELNSLGCTLNCKKNYISILTQYLKPIVPKLSREVKEKIRKNILRIFDVKDEKAKNLLKQAPPIIDYLCEVCKENFKSILGYLDYLGANYELNPYLVRGLDYYTNTVFEIYVGEQRDNAIAGGGRYDDLIKFLGGKDQPAVGAAFGIERIIDNLNKLKIDLEKEIRPKVFIAYIGDLGKKIALKLFEEMRRAGIPATQSFGKITLKSQLKYANKLKIDILIIVAHKEALENQVILRDSKEGIQESYAIDKVIDILKQKLKRRA